MNDAEYLRLKEIIIETFKGGEGSGNFGHEGRPGEVGGSGPGVGREYELPKLRQDDLEKITDRLERGLITADQANVDMVLYGRVKVIEGKFPQSVRKALNQAVRDKVLGHLPKDGLLPEVYFHPTFKYLAIEARQQIAKDKINRISGVLAHAKIDDGY